MTLEAGSQAYQTGSEVELKGMQGMNNLACLRCPY